MICLGFNPFCDAFHLQPSTIAPRQILPLPLTCPLIHPRRTDLPLGRGLLGGLGTPLGGGGGGTSGIPVALAGRDGIAPLTTGGGTSETSGSSLPVTTGGSEAGLDSGDTLLLDTGELLLLDLVLGLSLGVAV